MSPEETVKQCYSEESTAEIAKRLGLPIKKVYQIAAKYKLKKSNTYFESNPSGRYNGLSEASVRTRFTKGHTPFNKGKKVSEQTYDKLRRTMWPKGHKPANWKPIGSIEKRLDVKKRPYLWVKVSDSKWVLLHRHVWNQHHGEIPKDKIVTFKDGNAFNCDIQNLEVITRIENMQRNSIQRYPQELQTLIKVKSKLIRKIEKHGTQQTK